jgi:tRNA(Ile)-lysidine synthase
VIEKVHNQLRHRRLIVPGDRVAVAVSAGADSVALLRALLELREQLGAVISVAHFHHGIRGAEADSDLQFVKDLAANFGLELHIGAGDVPAYARIQKVSLEAAARELRHRWFAQLVREGKADKIATAHTLDDQAETVLMRIVRGTGSRGLSGIFPAQETKHLIRPLLEVSRRQVEAYLKELRQPWREDSSNLDLSHTRNRVRHELLPLLERDFNPGIRQTLADLAEVARGEAAYWDTEVLALLPRLVRPGKPSRSGRSTTGEASQTLSLDLAAFRALPLALQRHVLQELGKQQGTALEFKHIQQIAEIIQQPARARRLSLPNGLTAVLTFRELQISRANEPPMGGAYSYTLRVPGEVAVLELGETVRARVVPAGSAMAEYNPEALLDRARLACELTVRSWRAGDRFFPAKTRSPKKLKELLQAGRLGRELTLAERKIWPVVESAGKIVWVRGFAVPEAFAFRAGDAVLIEESGPFPESTVREADE